MNDFDDPQCARCLHPRSVHGPSANWWPSNRCNRYRRLTKQTRIAHCRIVYRQQLEDYRLAVREARELFERYGGIAGVCARKTELDVLMAGRRLRTEYDALLSAIKLGERHVLHGEEALQKAMVL